MKSPIHFDVNIELEQVRKMMAEFPISASRAAEVALDKTAYEIRDAVKNKMRRVFDSPVSYTLNSLRVTRTKNHNMQSSVWFKDPDRMEDHYLVPQVEGGKRAYKGFERALGYLKMVPGEGARINRYGNISVGQIRQVLSVLKRAELSAGYSANITSRSRKRNKKPRDYIYLPRGSGRMPPGIYQRVKSAGARGIGAQTKKKRGIGFGEFQHGKRKGTIVRARGLRPILVRGRQNKPVKPRLPFYDVASATYNRHFLRLFYREFDRRLDS